MKANELRIGNWLQWKADKRPFQVSIIDTTETSKETKAEPIPLTEEWLLKFDWNGFKIGYIDSYFKIDENGCLWYCGDFTGVVLLYVHQLQNLYFALTGEELILIKDEQ
jgi:hypothetical protein